MVIVALLLVQMLGKQLVALHQRFESLLEFSFEYLGKIFKKLFVGLDLTFQLLNALLQQLLVR